MSSKQHDASRFFKKFDPQDRINIPKQIIHHRVGEQHLFIAPSKFTWIVTNAVGALLLAPLSEGCSLQEAIEISIGQLGLDLHRVLDEMKLLLSEIEHKGFYDDVHLKEGNPARVRLQLYLTHACNLRCPHCYINAGSPMANELTVEEWQDVIQVFSELNGVGTINLSGGEPLYRKDLIEIAACAKDLGHQVILLTNGTLITPRMASRLADVTDRIQISLDGASEPIMDAIRGKGTFKKVLNSIALLKNLGVHIDLAVGAFPQNIEDLDRNLMALLDTINYSGLTVQVDDDIKVEGRAANLPSEALHLSSNARPTLIRLHRKLEKAGRTTAFNTLHFKMRNCGIGRLPTVNANGDVYPCPILRDALGNVRTGNLKTLFNRIFSLDAETDIDKILMCSHCEMKYICNGGCRIENLEKHRNYLVPACGLERKQKLYSRMLETRYSENDVYKPGVLNSSGNTRNSN